MKKQVVVIHGGDTFDTYEEYLSSLRNEELDFGRLKTNGWKENLDERLGNDFEVIRLRMPNPANAKFIEWKIWFEKLIPHLIDGVIFVGHSLGGIFLAKFLSENKLPKKISATFLIAAPHDSDGRNYSLADFTLPESLTLLQRQGGEIHLVHSKDDDVVPFGDLQKYAAQLPGAVAEVFEGRGHFFQEEFPEIVTAIKKAAA